MKQPNRFRAWKWTRVTLAAAATVVIGLFWINFAPPRLGGDSVYVVTSGISMEPRFHTGDLAILRPVATYQVGEIVGYRSPRFGIVMHRIIGESNGHFLMKGDNNNFVDTYHPTPSDVVGRLWLHIPKIGQLINTPRNRETGVAIATVAMAGVMAVPAERDRRRRKKDRQRLDDPPSGANGSAAQPRRTSGGGIVAGALGTGGQVVASVIIVVALAALTLAAFSYTRSTTTIASENLQYQQVGTWSYHAAARGDVYANGVATTGQPLYFSVTPVATVNFTYKFTSALPTNLNGSADLTALVTGTDGWSHSFVLEPKKSFTGPTVQLSGTLNLPTIENYLSSVQSQTSQVAGTALSNYTLTLTPGIHVAGSIAGIALQPQVFSPPINFSLLSNEAQLNYGAIGSATPLAQLIQPTSPGVVNAQHSAPAELSFLGLHPRVSLARNVALWALIGCLVALIILGLILRKAYRSAESQQIGARYGSILVAVQRPDALGEVGTVRMANIEDLVKIAQHQGRLILHCESESGRDYFVRDQSQTYLYSVNDHRDVSPPIRDAEAKAPDTVTNPVIVQATALGTD